MIKKRLVNLLNDSKKYILYNVLFQLCGLFSQILIVFTMTRIIDKAMDRSFKKNDLLMFCSIFLIAFILRIVSDKMIVKCSYLAGRDVKII